MASPSAPWFPDEAFNARVRSRLFTLRDAVPITPSEAQKLEPLKLYDNSGPDGVLFILAELEELVQQLSSPGVIDRDKLRAQYELIRQHRADLDRVSKELGSLDSKLNAVVKTTLLRTHD